MKIAISGSHGFIGGHLSKAQALRGHTILPITQELLYSPQDLSEFFLTQKPEYIYHLAAYGNMSNQKDVAMTVFANIIGTFNLLYASLALPYLKFVNFSSSSVTLPRETIYSAAKAGGERLCRAFQAEYNKPVITIRPYSVYGPGEADFRFIPTVINNLLKGEEIKLAEGYHDWIYIEDLISLTITLAESPNPDGDIFPLGTGMATSNQAVVTYLEQIMGKKAKVIPMKARSWDNLDWHSPLPIDKPTPLTTGLLKTYEYFKAKNT